MLINLLAYLLGAAGYEKGLGRNTSPIGGRDWNGGFFPNTRNTIYPSLFSLVLGGIDNHGPGSQGVTGLLPQVFS